LGGHPKLGAGEYIEFVRRTGLRKEKEVTDILEGGKDFTKEQINPRARVRVGERGDIEVG